LRTLRYALLGAVWLLALAAAASDDPGRIDAYVTPYYDSSGPVVNVGKYSSGLASTNPAAFVATIRRMKQDWNALTFVELYVGAIRLYDLGYRNEATYWFYSAQYKGRQFGLMLDQKKIGGMGSPAFELYHAQDAFFELAGPKINGFAYGNVDALVSILHRVQSGNRDVENLRGAYPGVAFVPPSEWAGINAGLNKSMGEFAASVTKQKSQIEKERAANGTAAKFSSLRSRPFPGGL